MNTRELQNIVDSIPVANFGRIKVRRPSDPDCEDDYIIRTYSPADAVRIIVGLRENGISAHGFARDAKMIGITK